MNSLLFLNWRDPWHPRAGGAELLTRRLAEGMAQRGWEVEWFSARYPGAREEEVRDGVRYIRGGSGATVHISAYLRYRRTAARFSHVVDEINTIPFYTPLYAKNNCTALINQLAQEVWHYEFPWPFGRFGALLEPLYLRPYRRGRTITISDSSAASLRGVGFSGPIGVIPMAVDEAVDLEMPPKAPQRDVVVVSRVTPSKRIDHALRAVVKLNDLGWTGTLHIVGPGGSSYCKRLQRLARNLNIRNVRFHGRVSYEERTRILRSASVLWLTSVREGWGLVVTEAARHWTPAVVYRVPGLVDSVADGETGTVVETNPEALAEATWAMLNGPFDDFAFRALQRSESLSWKSTIDAFERILSKEGSECNEFLRS